MQKRIDLLIILMSEFNGQPFKSSVDCDHIWELSHVKMEDISNR
jgi:hypothetical protein